MVTQTLDKIQCCCRHKVELYIYTVHMYREREREMCLHVLTLGSRFDSGSDSVREHFVPLIYFFLNPKLAELRGKTEFCCLF